MENARSNDLPLPVSHPLYDERTVINYAERLEMEDKPSRGIRGSLLLLSNRTRPDISTAVSMLGKYHSDPGFQHWKALRNVLRYLKGTMDYGIYLPTGSLHCTIVAYSNAQWASDHEKRCSRSGYLLKINAGPIIWSSKLPTATALSATEAEFNAMS